MKITITPAQLHNSNWSIIQQIRIAIFIVFASSLFSCTSSDPGEQTPEILIQQSDTLLEIQETNNASESGTTGKIITPNEAKSGNRNTSSKSKFNSHEIQGEVDANLEVINETNGAALMEFDSIVKQPK